MSTGMKALVTGACGMVGRHLCNYLEQKGVQTIKVDLNNSDYNGSVSDSDFVFKVLGKLDFDYVIHLAAITDIRKTIQDMHECFTVNSFGTLNMLELAARKNVKLFVYASSSNVHGLPVELPVRETTPFSPRVPYDYSKVISENLVYSYSKTRNLPYVITRSWLLFGEYDSMNRATVRFIASCLKNEPITLYNSGKDVTSPSHAINYAKLVYLALRSKDAVNNVFNFGGERVLSIKEYAELIKRITNSSSELVELPPRTEMEKEPMISYPTTEKIRKVLNYEYELSLEQGIIRTAEWVKEKLMM